MRTALVLLGGVAVAITGILNGGVSEGHAAKGFAAAKPLTMSKSPARLVDVAVMVDASEEMAGDKLADLKHATTQFVDALLGGNQHARSAQVALVPFSDGVRLPEKMHKRFVRPGDNSQVRSVKTWHWYYGWSRENRTYTRSDCVTAPVQGRAKSVAGDQGGQKASAIYSDVSNPACAAGTQNNLIAPLTSNAAELYAAIDDITAGGNRAGHVGMAWSKALLSSSAGEPQTRASGQGGAKIARQKIAVVVSGGDFNVQYDADGVRASLAKAPRGSSNTQARAACAAMKQDGVTVYAVGYDIDKNMQIAATLAKCASDPSKVFSADDGEDLTHVLRDIALEISSRDRSS